MRGFLYMFILLAGMFLLAGRTDYWQGWAFSLFQISVGSAAWVLFHSRADLIAERIKPGPGVKWWDRVFFGLYAPASGAVIAVGALDRGRFGWTGELPAAAYVISYAVMFVGSAAVVWAMWTNNFFSRLVRIQTDRGHFVIRQGPYRYVRHPGYVGGILILPSIALALGSIWALLPAGLSVLLLVGRTYLEDRTLHKELPGYAEYAQKVRFRLLPGLW